MKKFVYSIVTIIIVSLIITFLPDLTNASQKRLTELEIPQNGSAVAGIQKYNLPPVSRNLITPNLSARSVLVEDLITNTVLFQKDIGLRVPIASTTKIMTALVGSQYFKPNSILTADQGAEVIGSSMGLKKGESMSFRALLYGMLLNSGNDAAYTIAENYPGGVLGFVSSMNKKAAELGLLNTHFDNPAGFDSPNHYSTASDMAKITEEALKNYQLSRIFATKETEVTSVDKRYTHELHNLNKLLSQVKGVLGVKTGYTDLAKENLVTYVDRDNHKILTVVLGSDDRFGESTKLIDWTYNNFNWPQNN